MESKGSGIEVAVENGGDTSYYCEDFEWEDLRNEIETKSKHQCRHPDTTKFSESVEEASNKEAWQSFHQRHSAGTFFKERKYLLKEFPELLKADDSTSVLEVGCGSGSSVLPILRQNSSIVVYACDCSMVALERAQEMVVATIGISGAHRFKPFCCDFSIGTFPSWLCCTLCQESYQPQLEDEKGNYHLDADDVLAKGYGVTTYKGVDIKENADQRNKQCCTGGVDFVTLVSNRDKNSMQTKALLCQKIAVAYEHIFTLSSVPLNRMVHVIKECLLILKPGGMLFFRDYGLYDMTMLRFPPAQNIGDRHYVRGDGTFSYYFSLDVLRELFTSAGFVEIESRYCCVQLFNRRKEQKMQRVWVHGKFQKPPR
ncbi:hypothetical protein SUGI_0859940 [Cryptomeria japonica]|uniref:uncharacterized protein LOC131067087 isoform X3 n=1 Tax=Cryptomeria japonica TaxID=3369 RepID=UPI002414B915|nr:uncharacterized protein LOC131067087 isoform X3 [Cryptomeria japonica]GLJ41550.1 hypothetical protein SUGI_0859940 [Cryptomeria japonica]